MYVTPWTVTELHYSYGIFQRLQLLYCLPSRRRLFYKIPYAIIVHNENPLLCNVLLSMCIRIVVGQACRLHVEQCSELPMLPLKTVHINFVMRKKFLKLAKNMLLYVIVVLGIFQSLQLLYCLPSCRRLFYKILYAIIVHNEDPLLSLYIQIHNQTGMQLLDVCGSSESGLVLGKRASQMSILFCDNDVMDMLCMYS